MNPASGLSLLLALTLALAGCGTSEAPPTNGAADLHPYEAGPYEFTETAIAEGQQGAPRRGLLFAPTSGGPYPLVQFQHGFTSLVENYEFMLGRLASHGFVVFAPQMYDTGGNPSTAPGIPEEVTAAAQVAAWLKSNVQALPTGAVADPSRYGIAGHSRGGQVAWRMMVDEHVAASALAGVDPVDGNAPPFGTDTGPMVTGTPLSLGFPVHILGTGLGGQGGPVACAPTVRNYEHFFDAEQDPVFEVVATDHGHADMSDPDCPDCRAACVSNPSAGMPEFSAGQLVAYFALRLTQAGTAKYLVDVSDAPVAATATSK